MDITQEIRSTKMDRSNLRLTEDYLARIQEILKKRNNGEGISDYDYCKRAVPESRIRDAQASLPDAGVSLRDCAILDGDSFKDTPSVSAVKNFLKQPRETWCLVLAGQPGRGKSIAAAYWLKRLAYDWIVEKFEDGEENMGQRSIFTGQHWWSAQEVSRVSSRDAVLSTLMNRNNIVIDDLGTEYLDTKGHTLHRFDELITRRYSNYKRTIITTNLNMEGFKKRYGARIFSRIGDGGIFHGVTGESLRG